MKEQTGQKILKVYREKYSQKIDMKNALKWTKLPIRVKNASVSKNLMFLDCFKNVIWNSYLTILFLKGAVIFVKLKILDCSSKQI